MSPEVSLIILLVAPIVVLVLLRVSAALVFLSLCLGDVLAQFTSHDAQAIVSGASKAGLLTNYMQLGLLVAPALLTTLFMIKTVKGKYKRIFNVLPAAGVGVLTALLVTPLLPPGLSHTLTHAQLWRDIQDFQSGIVALAALICLFFLWLQRPKSASEAKAD